LEQPEAVDLRQLTLLPDVPPDTAVLGSGFTLVPNAARVSGGIGDALIDVDRGEHKRRSAIGLHAVTDLGLLGRLLALPLGELVRWDDLSPYDARRFAAAPYGTVECSPVGARRLLCYPVSVPLVVVRSSSWRRGLRRASAFEPFAQRVLILEGSHRDLDRLVWEADVLGVGVWAKDASRLREVLPPAPWQQKFAKGAGWRFRERAYLALLNATRPAR
jgi:hypothetical protein